MTFLALAPAQWAPLLRRIQQRYAGRPIILRQHPVGEEEPHLVLWRTPLQELRAEAERVTVVAGHEPPFIDIELEPVTGVRLQLREDQSLDRLHLTLEDGTTAELVLDSPW